MIKVSKILTEHTPLDTPKVSRTLDPTAIRDERCKPYWHSTYQAPNTELDLEWLAKTR